MDLDWSEYPNFYRSEFECKCGHCGGRADMDPSFMHSLQTLRDCVGPLGINSGFRCPDHPEEKKKAMPGSHSIGKAADVVTVSGEQRYQVLSWVGALGFIGLGTAKGFIHLDTGHPYAKRPGPGRIKGIAMWKLSTFAFVLFALTGCSIVDTAKIKGLTADPYAVRVQQQQQARSDLRSTKYDLVNRLSKECVTFALLDYRKTTSMESATQCLSFIDDHMPSLATTDLIEEVQP